MAGRIGSRVVPASGQIRFRPVPSGRLAVGIEKKGIRAHVEVTGPRTAVSIR